MNEPRTKTTRHFSPAVSLPAPEVKTQQRALFRSSSGRWKALGLKKELLNF